MDEAEVVEETETETTPGLRVRRLNGDSEEE